MKVQTKQSKTTRRRKKNPEKKKTSQKEPRAHPSYGNIDTPRHQHKIAIPEKRNRKLLPIFSSQQQHTKSHHKFINKANTVTRFPTGTSRFTPKSPEGVGSIAPLFCK